MVIGKHWMRLLREGLLRLYSEFPTLRDCTVYYMATNEGDWTTRATAVRSLFSLEFLPWPEATCIIAVEEPQVHPTEPACLTLVARTSMSQYNAATSLSDAQTIETLVSVAVAGNAGKSLIGEVGQLGVFRKHYTPEFASAEEAMEALRKRNPSIGHTRGTAYAEYYANCMPLHEGDVWQGLLHKDGKWTQNIEAGIVVLSALANLAVPCHYRVLAQSNGFGNKATREAIRAKPFICIVAFDRLYTTQSTDGDGPPKKPHARCGHIRHLWKEAGLNRNALPPEPEKRLRLVADRRVRRIYVHPTWVGARTYEADGLSYDIQGGESELPLLN